MSTPLLRWSVLYWLRYGLYGFVQFYEVHPLRFDNLTLCKEVSLLLVVQIFVYLFIFFIIHLFIFVLYSLIWKKYHTDYLDKKPAKI